MIKRKILLAAVCAAVALSAQPGWSQETNGAAPTSPPQCNFGPYIVFFDLNDARINADAAATLDKAVSGYFNCGGGDILLSGHSDSAGPAGYNLGLSERRTAAVEAYLVSKGIPASRISREAYGEIRPRVAAPDGVSEPQNRRVEIQSFRLEGS